MKRLVISALCVSIFFLGIGALVEDVAARFKSDEKALELIRKARIAIGGEAAITAVNSMRIVGRTTHTIKIDGTERTEQGDTEIAMQLPDKMTKMVKIGEGKGDGQHKIVDHHVDVIRMSKEGETLKMKVADAGAPTTEHKKIVVKKDDGTVMTLTGADADKFIAEHPDLPAKKEVRIINGEGKPQMIDDERVIVRKGDAEADGSPRQNELLRTTLSLLLTAPQGMDVVYTLGGESTIDGVACNVVNAAFGGETVALFLDRSSNLPVAMNFTGMRMPKMIMRHAPDKVDTEKKDVVIVNKMSGMKRESAAFQVRFSDYRSVGGVQLPHKWTTTMGDKVEESFDVTTYEINPANIAESFANQKVVVRTKQ